MLLSSLLSLAALHVANAVPTPANPFEGSKIEYEDYEAFAPATELKVASHIAHITAVNGSSKSSEALLNYVLAKDAQAPLKSIEGGNAYGLTATVAGESYELIFDTGSSDLWIPVSNFQCVNAKGAAVAQSKCDFGKLYSGTFKEGQIKNENFNITYGDGNFVLGDVGHNTVAVAGISVAEQEMALAHKAYFAGSGTSGIFGFAFEAITSAYPGTTPDADKIGDSDEYQPWIFHAISENKVKPMFSLALLRGANGGGQLALGGLPSIKFDHSFTSTPIIKVTLKGEGARYAFYAINTGGIVLGDEQSNGFPAIVDSGTTLAYLPNTLAEDINASFDPPAQLIDDELFEVECDAKAPHVAVLIGGKPFTISPKDLIPTSLGKDPSTGLCVSGIQAGGSGPYILGDTFLKSVVAVFDIGDKTMRFAPHENY